MWNPGLDNDHLTLQEVFDNFLDRYHQDDMPWQVKWIENPKYKFAFSGAVDLYTHDCIHILLGIGNRPDEETFVIGFTMGSSPNLKGWEMKAYRWLSQHFYPEEYKFSYQDLTTFNIGVYTAKAMGIEDLSNVPFKEYEQEKLGDIRKRLGVESDLLKSIYKRHYPG
mgnify:CR=1 FL=1